MFNYKKLRYDTLKIAKKSTTFRRWLNVIIKSKKYL